MYKAVEFGFFVFVKVLIFSSDFIKSFFLIGVVNVIAFFSCDEFCFGIFLHECLVAGCDVSFHNMRSNSFPVFGKTMG